MLWLEPTSYVSKSAYMWLLLWNSLLYWKNPKTCAVVSNNSAAVLPFDLIGCLRFLILLYDQSESPLNKYLKGLQHLWLPIAYNCQQQLTCTCMRLDCSLMIYWKVVWHTCKQISLHLQISLTFLHTCVKCSSLACLYLKALFRCLS